MRFNIVAAYYLLRVWNDLRKLINERDNLEFFLGSCKMVMRNSPPPPITPIPCPIIVSLLNALLYIRRPHYPHFSQISQQIDPRRFTQRTLLQGYLLALL